MEKLDNIHPGEVLLEEFLVPMGLSQNRIAREIGVPPPVASMKSFMANRPLPQTRRFDWPAIFGTSEGFWMGLQTDYDLEQARNRLGKRLEAEVSTHAA